MRNHSHGGLVDETPVLLGWLCRLQLRNLHQQLRARARKKQKQQANSKETKHRSVSPRQQQGIAIHAQRSRRWVLLLPSVPAALECSTVHPVTPKSPDP